MRAEAVAGAVADPDDLSLGDLLADRDQDLLLVGVASGQAAAVVNAGVVAVAALVAGDLDAARGGCTDRSARGHGDVDSLVHPAPAHPEAGDDGAVDGPDQAMAA